MPNPVLSPASVSSNPMVTPLEPADFAWEVLRRTPSYRASVSLRAASSRDGAGVSILTVEPTASPWGLQFRGGSEHPRGPSGAVLASLP